MEKCDVSDFYIEKPDSILKITCQHTEIADDFTTRYRRASEEIFSFPAPLMWLK